MRTCLLPPARSSLRETATAPRWLRLPCAPRSGHPPEPGCGGREIVRFAWPRQGLLLASHLAESVDRNRDLAESIGTAQPTSACHRVGVRSACGTRGILLRSAGGRGASQGPAADDGIPSDRNASAARAGWSRLALAAGNRRAHCPGRPGRMGRSAVLLLNG